MFSFFKKKPKNIPAPLDDSQLEQDAAPIMRDLAADVSQTTPNSAEAESVAFDFGTLESEALKSEALESEALKSESLDDQALEAAAHGMDQ